MTIIILLLLIVADVSTQSIEPMQIEPIRIEPIKNVLGGVYSDNVTLFFRNSPYRIQTDLTVEVGSTMTIETGVQLYFDSGVGLRIKGSLYAVGSPYAHIQMLPYQSMFVYDNEMPKLRLVDGPTVRQGRLQVLFRDRWRSVCTQVTNWTSIDFNVACKSMGYSDGGLWKWFRRNNDTYPFVMPRPDCWHGAKSFFDCPGVADPSKIPLSENLCQGEDDIGMICWGPPNFSGWARHWKGLQFYGIPYEYVNSDPDMVSVQKQSLSRLEYIDIKYAGYDGTTKNVTSAIWIEGVPPFMNGLNIVRSARDGIYIFESSGPVLIANSTILYNRGHGIVIDNTADGRVFINETVIEHNYGDGVWYKQKTGGLQLIHSLRNKRQSSYYEEEQPRVDMCQHHTIPSNLFFPHLIRAHLVNGSAIDATNPYQCWLTLSLPPRLPYTYTLQFITVLNRNPPTKNTTTWLIICDANIELNGCALQRYRIPILNEKYPQSLSLRTAGQSMFIGLRHEQMTDTFVIGDVDIQFRVYASVEDKAFYGLNITNSRIVNNTGNGINCMDIRERTALTNVTITDNQGLAGFLIRDGAADIWINASQIDRNWGDGINVSYAGGSITVNGTSLSANRMRGCAFHQNTSSPYINLHQEIVFKGRPSNNINYLRTLVSDNWWGGILVGNFCVHDYFPLEQPKVLINYVEMVGNFYHPAFEYFSCQSSNQPVTMVDVTGSRFERGTGMCIRIEPAVNIRLVISSNQFLNNNNTALLIRNREHPQLSNLHADVTISKNQFKFNTAQYIVSIGLNEDAEDQQMIFNQQNEIRENTVINPYPHLKPRSTPYAAVVVSSSNVRLHRNCFKNINADYEIATDLMEHAKWIDARENNWGFQMPEDFMPRIFDQFNRYSLANIDIDPYAAVCNQRNPHIALVQQYFRQFRKENQPFVLGGTIFENQDLPPGRYTVTDDLQVVPGAKLSIAPGTQLQFYDGIGMLVQGELSRMDFSGSSNSVTFTSRPFTIPVVPDIRLVDENDNDRTLHGRLEVNVNGEWGTVCNRSWTVNLAIMACNQLGLTTDPEYFENWRIFPSAGSLPMVMDNIRCEEREYDITKCRHDGVWHNINMSCRPTEVVGLRCAEPQWAGVRYSLLANPPTVTGQTSMNNWIIEKAGVFDSRIPIFTAALQIDWNYHSFHALTIRDNYWNGLDIVYNDLTKKPTIRESRFVSNRRHGIRLRSIGLSITNVHISENGYSGVRYNPSVEWSLQRDIVTWLDRRDEPEMEANNVFIIPKKSMSRIELVESQLNHRKFLIARPTIDCPLNLVDECVYDLQIIAATFEYGLSSRIGVQIVNRVGNESDEDAIFTDPITGRHWSARNQLIDFPIISSTNRLQMRYTRRFGRPALIILLLFFDSQEYVDRFVHVYESVISYNQYGISTSHYSNFTHPDGSILIRWAKEKLWFQKCNFTDNGEAVVWVNSPVEDVYGDNAPIAEIEYHIDNCSVTGNRGPLIETHKDLYRSANVFFWHVWSCTFEDNRNSGMSVYLPDTYNLLARQTHSIWITESRFINNTNFQIQIDGYYTFANISSNNFTQNRAHIDGGIIEITGMEKQMYMEKNRFQINKGAWIVKYSIQSQTLLNVSYAIPVPAFIRYNYFMHNYYLNSIQDYVDSWPRSYAVGIFGAQKVDIHFNRFKNLLLDFELISGCKPINMSETMNVTLNWWGTGNDAEIAQRIFDFDDWNTFMLASYTPFFVTEELFIDWYWWTVSTGQLGNATFVEPSIMDLKGRMYHSKTLPLIQEQWNNFPFYYKPFRPYRIIKDLTIMPGATLTIEAGVEVHIWPNVRILVLGQLIAEGTYWLPIRFKPINTTEYAEIHGRATSRYRRSTIDRELSRNNRAVDRFWNDPEYRKFPALHRLDAFYQKFHVHLVNNGTEDRRSGFVEIYNATSGEMIPLCDRQFTRRNAEVVCRELGMQTQNVYQWVTARWAYNPKLRIVKSYVEPRQCRGDEPSLDSCELRLTGDLHQWQCMDSEHFNFVYCGVSRSVNDEYIGSWGGITFSHPTLINEGMRTNPIEQSVLRHVEIVGAGFAHNDTMQSAALQLIYRTPILDHVNITNSSMHGVQIISPRDRVVLNHLNVSNNHGYGISILTTNLQSSSASSGSPFGNLTIPYDLYGMLDLCAAGKQIKVSNRILIYYKYDSYPVDCVKVFVSTMTARKIGFRILLANFYDFYNPNGRPDALRLYSDASFNPNSLIVEFRGNNAELAGRLFQSPTSTLAIHLRATAADGNYGFIAEVASLPSAPDSEPVQEVAVRFSRFLSNDQGALIYRSVGELSPALIIDDSYCADNGVHIWGNISTSMAAIQLYLHNTQVFLFRSNMIYHNQGGMLVTAQSSSSIARLNGLIKNSAFSRNMYFGTLTLMGTDYQKMTLVGNIITKNWAPFYDTVHIERISSNITSNVITNNTGTHTIDLSGYSKVRSESQLMLHNIFTDNIALGAGFQYYDQYGYQPAVENNEFARRPKRQAPSRPPSTLIDVQLQQGGTSFDWYTHVGDEVQRYRSTIVAGSSQQIINYNYFSDPANTFELTTVAQPAFGMSTESIDATHNYWGYPSTASVAAAVIRDHGDYAYLVKANYMPVLESNTSLIEGDCPAGWFQAGIEEFKSCYLYVGAAMPYTAAVEYCQVHDAFIPYFRVNDVRQSELAARIDRIAQRYMTDIERLNGYSFNYDTQLWVSGVVIPSSQCGWLSSRSGSIGLQNCQNLLPFVCEKGTKPYQDPFLWRGAGVVALIALIVLLILLVLFGVCWYYKSRRRTKQHFDRKNSIRASLRSNKLERERLESQMRAEMQMRSVPATVMNKRAPPSPTDIIQQAHKNLVHGRSSESLSKFKCSPSSTTSSISTSGSTSTRTPTTTATMTTTYDKKSGSTRTYSESGTYLSDARISAPKRQQPQVSITPNPYAEIFPQLNTFQSSTRKSPVVFRDGSNRRNTDLSQTSSSRTGTGTYCSTCPTDSINTTITEEGTTTSSRSSFDDTLSGRSTVTDSDTTISNRRPLLLAPTRSSPNIAGDSELLLHHPSKWSTMQNGTGRPLPPPRPRQPPPMPPPPYQQHHYMAPVPSRSLVDLHTPGWYNQQQQTGTSNARRASDERPPLETSM